MFKWGVFFMPYCLRQFGEGVAGFEFFVEVWVEREVVQVKSPSTGQSF